LIEGGRRISRADPGVDQTLRFGLVDPEGRIVSAIPEGLIKVDGYGGLYLVVDICPSGPIT
jgi:hypothetical protein